VGGESQPGAVGQDLVWPVVLPSDGSGGSVCVWEWLGWILTSFWWCDQKFQQINRGRR